MNVIYYYYQLSWELRTQYLNILLFMEIHINIFPLFKYFCLKADTSEPQREKADYL